MFSSGNTTKEIPVLLRFADGRAVQGKLFIAMSSDLPRTLNGECSFVEFEALGGERSYVAKAAIAEAVPSVVPEVKKLDAGTDSNEGFNPYRILKIAPGSDAETAHDAYIKLAKMYHPDRFSGAQLPPEMARYAENMTQLVNAAFQMLNADQQGSDPVQAPSPAPGSTAVNQ